MHRRAFLALAALAPAVPARAQSPLALRVDYAADGSFGSGERARPGRLFRTRAAIRQETPQAGPIETAIVRLDRQLVWLVMPGVRTVFETDLGALDLPFDALTTGQGLAATPLGQETVAGVPTTRYRVRSQGGATFEGDVWASTQGVIMRIDGQSQYKARRSRVAAQFHNVRVGPQNPALFELPGGFRKQFVPADQLQEMLESLRNFRLRLR